MEFYCHRNHRQLHTTKKLGKIFEILEDLTQKKGDFTHASSMLGWKILFMNPARRHRGKLAEKKNPNKCNFFSMRSVEFMEGRLQAIPAINNCATFKINNISWGLFPENPGKFRKFWKTLQCKHKAFCWVLKIPSHGAPSPC